MTVYKLAFFEIPGLTTKPNLGKCTRALTSRSSSPLFSFPRLDNHFLRRQRDQRPQCRVIPSSIIRRHTSLHTRRRPQFPIKLHMLWRQSQQQQPSISTRSTLGNCISPRAVIRALFYTSLGRRQPCHERLERVEPAHDGKVARAVEHGVRYRDRRVGRAAAGGL